MIRKSNIGRVVAGLVLLAAALAVGQAVSSGWKILYQKPSQFNQIIVRENSEGLRELLFEEGGAVQSAMKVNDPTALVVPYTRVTMSALAFVPRPQRMLIVGLGGGSMPKFLRQAYPESQIDVAELDPAVADVARQFFAFRDDARLAVHIGDGRKFIETSENRYDIIFLDAYGADSIPYALATREFLRAVRQKLAPGGIAVANVWSAPINKLYPSMVRTYQDVFDELHIIRVPARSNRILIALPRKENLTQEQLLKQAGEVRGKGVAELDLPAVIREGYQEQVEPSADAKVLTDAAAPKE